MKSDREFLDGIYRKAREHQKNEQNELINKETTFYHRGYKTLRSVLVASMAIALISIGIYAYDLKMFPFQAQSDDMNKEGYSITPEVASHEMVRGVDGVALVDTVLPIEVEEAMKEGIVVRGKVPVLLESESVDEFTFNISKVYSGEEKPGTEIKVNARNQSISTYYYNQLTGTEDILLYLKKDEDNQYILAHENYGIFSYYEQVDGFDIFIGVDSVKLNTKIFTESVK